VKLANLGVSVSKRDGDGTLKAWRAAISANTATPSA
jgi:hypothetical protein